MGNRANIVLVDDDGWQFRYSHWGGCRLLDALIAGPERAKRYILAQQEGEFWTDEIWADGGMVLDLTKRHLLFFGEELMNTMNDRRAIFEVLDMIWPDYSISWAYDATAEIAAYVDADVHHRDKVYEPELTLTSNTDKLHHLVTVVGADGRLRAWPLWWGISAAWHGPQLVDRLPGPGQRTLELGILPESGVHLDLPNKTLGIWLTNPVPGLDRWLPRLWPGWQVERWDDRFEEQFRRCGPNITAPELDIASGVVQAEKWLRKRVFQSYADSPQGAITSLARMFGAQESDLVEDSSDFLRVADHPSARDWERFEQACAQVLAKRTAGEVPTTSGRRR